MQEQSRNVYFEMWSELHRTNHAASSKLLNVDKEIGFMEVHIGVAAIEAELRAAFQPKRFSLNRCGHVCRRTAPVPAGSE
jgi:hypothetical protein